MNKRVEELTEKAFNAYRKKKFPEAAELFEECIHLLEEQQEQAPAAEMRNNLSVVLLELKRPEESLNVLQGTDLVFAGIGDKKRQAMTLGNIASALQALNKLPEALSVFEQSADLFKEINETELRSITLRKISDLQLKTGKQLQALASLEAAYDQQHKKGMKDRILGGFLRNIINKLIHRS